MKLLGGCRPGTIRQSSLKWTQIIVVDVVNGGVDYITEFGYLIHLFQNILMLIAMERFALLGDKQTLLPNHLLRLHLYASPMMFMNPPLLELFNLYLLMNNSTPFKKKL